MDPETPAPETQSPETPSATVADDTAQPQDGAAESAPQAEATAVRSCPRCGAPVTDADQHWCLECGSELPRRQRHALRPVVGIATTLTVLVGAASAAGFTLLQDGKQPPPPAATIAQAPPPVTQPTVTTPPADATLPDSGSELRLPDTSTRGSGGTGGGSSSGSGAGSSGSPSSGSGSSAAPSDVPDLSNDVDTSTPNPDPPPDDAGEVDTGSDDGSVQDDPDSGRAQRRAARPRLIDANVALSAAAIPYAPYVEGDADLGDATLITDGSPTTAWKTPEFDDPATNPQLGVYVDLVTPERITRLVLSTPTPGMTFEVYGARNGPPKSITAPGWSHLATKEQTPGKTTITLPSGTTARYVLIWVTGLPAGARQAEIGELQIISKQPE
ncbi:hypothetical protein Q5424_05925 [Conexibacter sp. JD483]|uniref:discoidin domain-containing protein n=1 Tax=unclassified Conexibacter TaxID=2627773 RepID=UPI0027182DA5|nr:MULTISPECIES: hypothetical protein [unclassified Conexibacter]MDO8185120.1 hypothetical protein [Conexibacter sp. CPCC 205706]MDO8196830.1 hypothetical protein [Conexibacter sp. CPCC 205762]MDR9368606.1 hypothetical protein [Conexibacter sp. JD483]